MRMILVLLAALHAVTVSAAGRFDYGPRGGELPVPFDTANKKVELADGEAYILAGRVVLEGTSSTNAADGSLRTRVVFRVDLNEHPWLATAKRLNKPYYPLQGGLDEWRDLITAGKIKLPCIAHGVVRTYGSIYQYDIELERAQAMPVEPRLGAERTDREE